MLHCTKRERLNKIGSETIVFFRFKRLVDQPSSKRSSYPYFQFHFPASLQARSLPGWFLVCSSPTLYCAASLENLWLFTTCPSMPSIQRGSEKDREGAILSKPFLCQFEYHLGRDYNDSFTLCSSLCLTVSATSKLAEYFHCFNTMKNKNRTFHGDHINSA